MKANKTWLQRIFILLIAALLMQACGDGNKKEDGEVLPPSSGNPTNWNNNYSNPGVNSFTSFKSQVESGNFQGLNGYSFMNFVQCDVQTNSINSFSDFFDGWFDVSFNWNNSWEQQICGGNNSVDVGYTVSSGVVTGHRHGSSYTTVHNKLKSIVTNLDFQPMQYNATAFQVFSGGRLYIIDLAKPLVANPVMEFPHTNGYVSGNGFQYAGSTIAY